MTRRALRGDIQGMRATAVLLVMLAHAGVGWLPGGYVGVDVFFVISGFLMTGILIRELDSSGRLSLGGFYARRARRLLPASLTTLAFVGVIGWWVLPPLRRWDLVTDVAASAAFGMNWRMSDQAVDYLAATTGPPSALQHFWSLGVEEQFYFVWPVVLLGAAVLARRLGAPPRAVIAVAIVVVAAVSFGISIHETATNPAQAYFVTWTRIWELALGGLVALLATHLDRMPRAVAVVAGWLGLAAIAVAAATYGETTPFPGTAALLPVLGAAAVVAAGPAAGPAGPGSILGLLPMRRIGDWSYSLYLWHWPLLVLLAAYLERELTTREGLLVVAATFVPAYLSYRYVEEPVRRTRRLRRTAPALAVWGSLAATVLAGALLVGTLRPEVLRTDGSLANALAFSESRPRAYGTLGAGVLPAEPRGAAAGRPHQDDSYYPKPEQLADIQTGCITPYSEVEVVTCSIGNPEGRTRVVLGGDSHAVQWVRAMTRIARASNWDATLMAKQACPLSTEVGLRLKFDAACAEWQQATRQRLLADPPDLLVISQDEYQVLGDDGRIAEPEVGAAILGRAQAELFRELLAAGTRVVVLHNTPHFGLDVRDCLSKHPDDMVECSVPRARALRSVGAAQRASVDAAAGVTLVNLNDAICPTDRCAPVIGSVLVYQDANHATTTYLESLAPRLAALLPGAAKLP